MREMRSGFPLLSCLAGLLLLASAVEAAPTSKVHKRRGTSAATVTQPSSAPPTPPVAAPSVESAEAPSAVPVPAVEEAGRATPSASFRKPPIKKLDRRLVVAADFFFEKGRLNGTQNINGSARDEGFKYGRGFLSGSAWLLFPESSRFRWGPGLRILGRYSASVDNQEPYELGFLTQAFVAGEFSLPMAPKFDLLLGGRAGLGLLFPGGDFKAEINRLSSEGVGVWSVPRVGWLAGINAGTRWKFAERVALRGDLTYGLEQLFLFATHQNVDGLSFAKSWSTYTMRFGLTVGLEVSF